MNAKIILYIGACYLISYLIGGIVLLSGGPVTSRISWLLYVNAWVPAAVALAARLLTRQGFRDAGWGLRRPALLALAVTPILVFAGAVAVVALTSSVALASHPTLGTHTMNFGINLALNSLFVFGEEFGWRGYLQKHALDRLGVARGLLVLSLIWSFWHLPLDLMGIGYPNMDMVASVLLLRPMAMLGLGTLVGWVYLRTGSVWAACLVHGANNAVGGQFARIVDLSSPQNSLALVVVTVLYGVLGLSFLVVLRRAERDRAPAAEHQPTAPE